MDPRKGIPEGGAAALASVPKEGRWIARPRKPRWVLPVVSFTILASQLPTWLGPFLNGKDPRATIHFLLAFWGAVLLVVLVFGLVRSRRSLREIADAEAMIDGGFGDQYPADMTIVVEGRRLGSDRGVIWFSEGLMGFSGRAASFVLAPADVRPRASTVGHGTRPRQVPPNAIVLRNAPKVAYVVVVPLGRRAKGYRERLKAFLPFAGGTQEERLVRYAMVGEETSGERHWPPLELYDAQEALVIAEDKG